MSTWQPWLIVTTDTPHRIAIVRGRDAYRLCADLSPRDVPPMRAMGGGWVVNLRVGLDIEALARLRGHKVVIQEKVAS